MRELQKHHIVDIFVWADDNLPKQANNSFGGSAIYTFGISVLPVIGLFFLL